MNDNYSNENSPLHRLVADALAGSSTLSEAARTSQALQRMIPKDILRIGRAAELLDIGRYARVVQNAAALSFANPLAGSAILEHIQEWNRNSIPKLPKNLQGWEHSSLAKIRQTLGDWAKPSINSWVNSESLRALQRLNELWPAEQLERYESLATAVALSGIDAESKNRLDGLVNSTLESLRNPANGHAKKSIQEVLRDLAREAVAAELAAAKTDSASTPLAPSRSRQRTGLTVMQVLGVILLLIQIINEVCLLIGHITQLTSADDAAVISQQWMNRLEEITESAEFAESVSKSSVCWTVDERHVILRELPGSQRSRALSVLKPGQEVFVTGAINKWARVVVVPEDAEADGLIEGWVLKKYFQTTCGKRILPQTPNFSLLNT